MMQVSEKDSETPGDVYGAEQTFFAPFTAK
jgi:hypothetical protein